MASIPPPDEHHDDSGSTQLSSPTSNSSGSQSLGPQSNLDEIIAPPPISESSEKPERQRESLENRRSKDEREFLPLPQETEPAQVYTQNGRLPVAPQPSKKRVFREFLRMACIVGYLIFFSIAGTILRLAIECLTFYPGTPRQH
ncbi:uncharacterized protein N7503_002347 [Penicillium pulvis]|uniref:uncharacterized protein n=1 Tax=Penicillium pulvis TaxID=1562058 RepID=UPI00254896A9|nr:uncharacterized protein N7503_002347 [Penicillium pulvis]KAJ5810129.1 hypothetical protein N7503_002347 [Penicillium pulvis]